jgi:hypothetical protein
MSGDEKKAAPSGQPRDSRVEAFLRQAEGILSAQRQWSAQTQIKLKALAKELKLPPELFEAALEQMADPARQTPPSRWEQAFCDYLERQFERLPGDILSLPQERKALQYGQRKFQLSPDACERCMSQVAGKLQIARISDSQAVAYAQTEVARLVSKSTLPPVDLQEQVCHLARRWGVEPKQAVRLLQAELSARNVKRRRIWFRSVGLIVGVLGLSVALIVSIIALGRILSPPTPLGSEDRRRPPRETPAIAADPTPRGEPGLQAPAWWTERQSDFAARLAQESDSPTLLTELMHPQAQRRRDAYASLWQVIGDVEQRLTGAHHDQPRWLRQPDVQAALLDWFWREPDLTALPGWMDGLHRLRAVVRSPAALPPGERTLSMAATPVLSDLLTATAADTLFLRAMQQTPTGLAAEETDPSWSVRRAALARGHLNWPALSNPTVSDGIVEQVRQRWLAENLEQVYRRLQELRLTAQVDSRDARGDEPEANAAWQSAVAAAAESVRLIPDPNRRSRLLLLWWAGVATVDPRLAAAAWPELDAALPRVPEEQWGPLLESWYLGPADSEWSRGLDQRFAAVAAANQLTLSDNRPAAVILLQRALRIRPLKSSVQTQLRRDLVRRQIQAIPATAQGPLAETIGDSPDTWANWAALSHAITLAAMIATAAPYADFDQEVGQATWETPAPTPPRWQAEPFVDAAEMATRWDALRQARDPQQYQLAVQGIVELLEPKKLWPLPMAQRCVGYLRGVVAAEQRAAWLQALKPAGDLAVQAASNAAPTAATARRPWEAVERLLAQPTVALALADACDSSVHPLGSELDWLGWSPWVAHRLESPDTGEPRAENTGWLARELRRSAAQDLQIWDARHAVTRRGRLAQAYRAVLAVRASSSGQPPADPSAGSTLTFDPLIPVLRQHDRWAEQVIAPMTADPSQWLADYRSTVDNTPDPLRALEVAELQVLAALADHWPQGDRP